MNIQQTIELLVVDRLTEHVEYIAHDHTPGNIIYMPKAKKLFPVDRPTVLKRADQNFFYSF